MHCIVLGAARPSPPPPTCRLGGSDRTLQATESVWSLEGQEVLIMLPKDDPYFWKALFEGGEEKGHYDVLKELARAASHSAR